MALAYRVCHSKVDRDSSPGVLVLFGAPGGGKTHLLRAMADAARQRSRRVESTRAIDMIANVVRELTWTQAPRGALSYYEQLDLLIVDDLQWLADKTASQRHLGELFRRMVARGATVACASSVGPDTLPALVSVLQTEPSYLPIRIGRPQRRELKGMIRHVSDLYGVPLSTATVELLAERCAGDLGRVHGLVMQFAAATRWASRGAASAALVRVMDHVASQRSGSFYL